MVYTALSDSTTRSQFTRRKDITITTDGTSTPTDYQVKLTIAHEPEMQADFDDIRFNTRDGDYIDYWIESYTASTTATVWVELPDAITHPGSDTIMMYYGNASLSDGSAGDDVFSFFDDFNDDSIDTNKWNTDGSPVESGGVVTINSADEGILGKTAYGMNYAVRGRCNLTQPSTGEYGAFGWSATLDGATPYEIFAARPDPTLWALDSASNYSVLGTSYFGSYHIYEVTRISTSSHKFLIDDSEKWDSVASSSADLYPVFYLYAGAITHTLDWVLVRVYISNEPTLSYGTAQHQRRTPQFIG